MERDDLFMVCMTSFFAVFLLLAFLAVVMRILTKVLPEKVATIDAAVLAAITTAASTLYPGIKITKLKEIK